MNLSENDRQGITERAERLEARTGVQVVAVLADKCDAYPEIPWKAFALGAALAALAVALGLQGAILATLALLGAGAAAALATIFLPAFARLFLVAGRRDAEVRQYAESLFLRHALFNTRNRCGILILVGLFERSVVILPDSGLRERIGDAELKDIVALMTPALSGGRQAAALQDGLNALEALLVARGFAGGEGDDEIVQEVIEEKGA
ncbi:MAG: TPM domain-containing protein [Betaproteobacteria bacterium]|jgi:putative membrane protein|nr:TPM domain-containing protein [Betaproteobacteria bacterium]